MGRYNKAFRDDYDKIFKEDPAAANIFLLLFDLADSNGRVHFKGTEDQAEDQLAVLFNARFNDATEHQFRKRIGIHDV